MHINFLDKPELDVLMAQPTEILWILVEITKYQSNASQDAFYHPIDLPTPRSTTELNYSLTILYQREMLEKDGKKHPLTVGLPVCDLSSDLGDEHVNLANLTSVKGYERALLKAVIANLVAQEINIPVFATLKSSTTVRSNAQIVFPRAPSTQIFPFDEPPLNDDDAAEKTPAVRFAPTP